MGPMLMRRGAEAQWTSPESASPGAVGEPGRGETTWTQTSSGGVRGPQGERVIGAKPAFKTEAAWQPRLDQSAPQTTPTLTHLSAGPSLGPNPNHRPWWAPGHPSADTPHVGSVCVLSPGGVP